MQTILLLGLYPGVNGLLLPDRLAEAGFRVVFGGALEHLAALSGRLAEVHELPRRQGQLALDGLRRLFEAPAAPLRIVPLDEPSMSLLESFGQASAEAAPPWAARMLAAGRDSLGAVAGKAGVPVRQRSHAWAQLAGVAVPAQCDNAGLDTALAFGRSHGYPLYLKQENSAGGVGVRRLDDAAAVHAAHAEGLLPGPHGSVLQQALPGRLGMFTAVAEQGRMLAGFGAEQVQARGGSLAPSSVVRLGPYPAMAAAAERFIATHGLSGIHGWDFMLAPGDARPHLIEWNPRAISISHLGYMLGADLCAAWAQALRGEPAPVRLAACEATVALFPYESARDPHSPWLYQAVSDLPWTDPTLVTRVLGKSLRFK